MTNEQQQALQMLEQGVPHIINIALQLERVLLQHRSLMSPQEWQEVMDTWRAQVKRAIAADPEMNTPEVWERLQSYLLPMLQQESKEEVLIGRDGIDQVEAYRREIEQGIHQDPAESTDHPD